MNRDSEVRGTAFAECSENVKKEEQAVNSNTEENGNNAGTAKKCIREDEAMQRLKMDENQFKKSELKPVMSGANNERLYDLETVERFKNSSKYRDIMPERQPHVARELDWFLHDCITHRKIKLEDQLVECCGMLSSQNEYYSHRSAWDKTRNELQALNRDLIQELCQKGMLVGTAELPNHPDIIVCPKCNYTCYRNGKLCKKCSGVGLLDVTIPDIVEFSFAVKGTNVTLQLEKHKADFQYNANLPTFAGWKDINLKTFPYYTFSVGRSRLRVLLDNCKAMQNTNNSTLPSSCNGNITGMGRAA